MLMLYTALLDRMLELQRTDAEKITGRSYQRRTAPIRMRRRCEDRLVKHVFPIAGEFLLGGDARGDGVLKPAGAGNDYALADRGGRRLTESRRRHVELGERLHKSESGFLA